MELQRVGHDRMTEQLYMYICDVYLNNFAVHCATSTKSYIHYASIKNNKTKKMMHRLPVVRKIAFKKVCGYEIDNENIMPNFLPTNSTI